jgi:hypothetical protein
MNKVLIILAIIFTLGIIGGGSQGNLPFQNGNGIHGNPATYSGP